MAVTLIMFKTAIKAHVQHWFDHDSKLKCIYGKLDSIQKAVTVHCRRPCFGLRPELIALVRNVPIRSWQCTKPGTDAPLVSPTNLTIVP